MSTTASWRRGWGAAMPSQHDFEKVNRDFIIPMTSLYKIKIEPTKFDALIEDLKEYDSEILKQAVIACRKKFIRFPCIAHIIGVCASLKPKPKYTPVKYGRQGSTQIAEQVMRSPIGQRALAAGVGMSLWIKAEWDGIRDFTDADIEKFLRTQKNSYGNIEHLKTSNSPINNSLVSIWETMAEREKNLYEKYYGKQEEIIT